MRGFICTKDDHDKFEDEQTIELVGFGDNLYNGDDCKYVNRDIVQDVTIPMFGRDISTKLPYISIASKDIAWRSKGKEFVSFLTELNKTNEISDMRYRVWQHVLSLYDIIETRDIDLGTRSVFFSERDEKKKKYDPQSIILAKEMMDGYYNFNFYKADGNTQAEPIGRIEDINIDGTKCQVYGAYSNTLRNLMFGDTDFYRKKKRFLQKWQYKIIKQLAHITVFTAKRRMGKSFLLSFLANREITKQRISTKPVKVLFISKTENTLLDVKDYINSMGENLKGVYEVNKKENTVSFYQIDEDGSRKLNGVIKFLTAGGIDPGIGAFADLIIIDEANRIDEKVFTNIMPIVTNEGARLICGSTLYPDSDANHWFYTLLNEAEKHTFNRGDIDEFIKNKWFEYGLDKGIDTVDLKKITKKLKSAMRYTGLRICGDEDELQDEDEKKFSKDMMSRNKADYYAQYRGVYQEEAKVFNYSHCIGDTDRGAEKYEYIVITYDPAKKFDGAAVLFSGYKEGKIYDFDEMKLEGDYPKQLEQLVKIKDRYKQNSNLDVFLVMDQGGVGNVLFDMISLYGISFDLGISATVGNKITKSGFNERTVGKEFLVELTQKIISDGNVVFDKKLVNTFEEMNNYKRFEHSRGSGYEAAAGHDDFVSAQLMKNYFIYEYKAAKYDILRKDINRNSRLTDDDIKERYKLAQVEKQEEEKQLQIQREYRNLYNKFLL